MMWLATAQSPATVLGGVWILGKTRFCSRVLDQGARRQTLAVTLLSRLGTLKMEVVLAICISVLSIASGSALPQIVFGMNTSAAKTRSSIVPESSDLQCLPLHRCPALRELVAVNPKGIGEFDSCGKKMFMCPRLQKPKGTQECRCLTIPKCPALHKLAMERNFNELRRFKRCGFEMGAPKLCCPQDGIKRSQEKHVIQGKPADESESDNGSVTRDNVKPMEHPNRGDEGSDPVDERFGDTDSAKELTGICMKDNTDINNNVGLLCGLNSLAVRIIGGEDAKNHDYPWAAAIAYNASGKLKYSCGGALIHKYYVLTAAHCTRDLRGNTLDHVRLGHDNLNHPCGVKIGIEMALPHPNYDPAQNYINDIALLKLERPVNAGPTINLLCLPTNDKDNEDNEDRVGPPNVVGWGLTENGSNSDILQELTLNVVPNDKCTNEYRQSFIKRNFSPAEASSFFISESQICAKGQTGKNRTDSCRGDSGGPLMSESNGQWVLDGIVSFGTDKCDSEVPGVYTRVSKYLQWIDSIINSIE